MEEVQVDSGLARTMVLGLLLECSHGESTKGCVLNGQRQLSFSKQIQWVQSLKADELQRLSAIHSCCRRNRLRSELFHD